MSSFLDTAIEIAHEAGQILLAHRGVGFELKGAYDLVTAADRASEQFIVKRLREAFPTHGIVAEEGGRAELDAPMRWYVDPLDGTTNFAHGYPMWNVTLALAKNHEVIAGVVFDPWNRELFTAERGAGARLNGAPIHVSPANQGGGRAFFHRVSQPQAAQQCQHSFLLPTGDAVARCETRRISGDRPGLHGVRAVGRILGVWAHAVGYGGRQLACRRSGRHGFRHAR